MSVKRRIIVAVLLLLFALFYAPTQTSDAARDARDSLGVFLHNLGVTND